MSKKTKTPKKNKLTGAKTRKTEKLPLRLEWVEAGSLDDNPLNWRKHGQEQAETMREVLKNPNIGWAGALLYNERTKRLIDGHLRKSLCDPKELVPVLIGAWTEEQEKQILASHDLITQMAEADADVFGDLYESVDADGLWLRDLLHNANADIAKGRTDDDEEDVPEPDVELPEMECQPFEHYDYIVMMFRDEQDFQQACERFGIEKVQVRYPGGLKKVGLGRVIEGARVLQMMEGK